MDNFNQPNSGNQYNPDYRPPMGESSSYPSQPGSPADGEYSIRYQPGTNVYRTVDTQFQSPAYQSQSYQPAYSSAPSGSPDGARTAKAVIFTLLAVAIIAMGIVAGIWLSDRLTKGETESPARQETVTLEVTESPETDIEYIPSSGEKLTYAQIAAKFRSAVVSVTVYYNAYGWAS